MTGSQDKYIRVFDPDKKDEVVQKNLGHMDEVRALIHIPMRSQVDSSTDFSNDLGFEIIIVCFSFLGQHCKNMEW